MKTLVQPAIDVYAVWLQTIVQTHLTAAWNKIRTPDEEAEEDRLNDLWEDLQDSQKDRIWGLSADLYSLRDEEVCIESHWTAISPNELRQAMRAAYESQNWDDLLELLRRPPKILPRDQVDFLRGRIWMELGQPEIALLFFDNSSRLKPGRDTAGVMAFHCLKQLGDWDQARKRADRIANDPDASPRLKFAAGDVCYEVGRKQNSSSAYQAALDLCDHGLAAVINDLDAKSFGYQIMAAIITKALALEHLGRRDEALSTLDQAIQQFGPRSELQAARDLIAQPEDLSALVKRDALEQFRAIAIAFAA